ncbi:MAG: Rne/Rng family ribonuclease [Terracoccus sp.]
MAPNDSTEPNESTESTASGESTADAPAAEKAPPRKRASRRVTKKAATPATAPAAEASSASNPEATPDSAPEAAPEAEAAPAPVKKAVRKRATRKKAAPAPADTEVATDSTPAASDTPADDGEEAATPAPAAKAAPRARRSRARAKAPEAETAADAETTGSLFDAVAATDAAPGLTSGTTDDGANAPAALDETEQPTDVVDEQVDGETETETETNEPEEPAEPAVPSFNVLFQAPDPTKATTTRRRRSASRAEGAPESVAERAERGQAADADRDAAADERPAQDRERDASRARAARDQDDDNDRRDRRDGADRNGSDDSDDSADEQDDERDDAGTDSTPRRSRRRRGGKGRRGRGGNEANDTSDTNDGSDETDDDEDDETTEADTAGEGRSSGRRRGRSGRRGGRDSGSDRDAERDSGSDRNAADDSPGNGSDSGPDAHDSNDSNDESDDESDDDTASSRRRRRRRRAGSSGGDAGDDAGSVSTRVRQPRAQSDEPVAVRGSTRLEAKKQRRREGREAGRRRTVITEAEFLARREAVDRVMVVRNKDGRTQMGVLEDNVLVEHYIDQATNVSMAGNIYLGRVQNVLPSMEAAFVDIGKGRNAVLYAGEVNWDAAGLESNQPKRIEHALSSGQTVLVQVTKDPIGHKGARLTSQISLPGRYLVYVPNSSMTGISRKLPDTERARLKKILREVVPDSAGVIVRTAAEGATEEELRADVERLTATWEDIEARAEASSSGKVGKSKGRKKNGGSGSSPTGTAPLLLHGEPDLTVRVIRDVFNEDFKQLVVSGEQAWEEIHPYITSVAPDLADRVTKWTSEEDLFAHHRVDEQLSKAMDRKVWLPSGGSLVIDRTEAMTVVDVNTGKFIGSGGNLEETVTKNNIEAAEEIVRQLRLRDIGGIIVVDFIDMVLESNRDLVVRRLLECLGRDRTKHQVAEVTSLGLVQMTRKRVGSGLIEVFSETCEHCNGRGFIIHAEPVDKGANEPEQSDSGSRGRRGGRSSNGSGNGTSNGNGSTGNGAAPTGRAPEPARQSGPTAAQIAAAAHAAALKRAEAEHGEEHAHEHVAAQLEAHLEEHLQAATSGRAVTDEAGFPDDTGPWAGADAPIAETPSEVAAEPSSTDQPEQPEQSAPAEQPAAVEQPEPAPAAAPRGRRRRGRVIAPAGPPRAGADTASDGPA